MTMGDHIQRAWQTFVRVGVDGKALRSVIGEIDWNDDRPADLFFYVVIGKHDGEPEIDRFVGPMASDYFEGASPAKLVAAISVHPGMTKKDLLEVDVAEESGWYDHPDWSDG